MSSALIRSAWAAKIWSHPTALAITDKFHQYDVAADLNSTTEIARTFDSGGEINFFSQSVTRLPVIEETRGGNQAARYRYDVEVFYYLQKVISDSAFNYNQAVDRLEAIDALVLSELGATWDGTVGFWRVSGLRRPEIVTVASRTVWRVGYSYEAVHNA